MSVENRLSIEVDNFLLTKVLPSNRLKRLTLPPFTLVYAGPQAQALSTSVYGYTDMEQLEDVPRP
jgi:hypothetical protein